MEIRKVGVLGCGLMGSGIAQVTAQSGFATVVREVSPELLDKGLKSIDKNLVRRIYENRVRLAAGEPPTLLQAEAANAYARLRALNQRLYLTQETHQVLQLRPPLYAARILAQTQALKKGRYLRRWARRLRDFVFSREDAVILAYGSFGIAPGSQSVGVNVIITGDLRLVTNFNTRFAGIKERFDQMVPNLPEPYRRLSLPEVVATATVLADW